MEGGGVSLQVREELRERRTGLPCDERQRADLVAMRQTFNFMSFVTRSASEGGFGGFMSIRGLRPVTGFWVRS